jgi:hypothetical protein
MFSWSSILHHCIDLRGSLTCEATWQAAVQQTCLKLSLCGTPGLAPAQLCAPRTAWVHWFRSPHPLVQRAAVVRLMSDAHTRLVEPGEVWRAFYRSVRAATSIEVIIGTRNRPIQARNALLLLQGNGCTGNARLPHLGRLHVTVQFEASERVHDAAYAGASWGPFRVYGLGVFRCRCVMGAIKLLKKHTRTHQGTSKGGRFQGAVE